MSAAPPEIIQQLETFANVSRETLERLEAYLGLLAKWQKKINLVSNASLDQAWTRHVVDSAQLWPLASENALIWTDLGSGAGFPGIVLGILGCERPGFAMHLVESDQRKAAFLREAIRVTGAAAEVHCARIEEIEPISSDVVTARALAPLKKLLVLSNPFVKSEGIALFLKGRSVDDELTQAAEWGTFNAEVIPSHTDRPSHTDQGGSILKLSHLIPA